MCWFELTGHFAAFVDGFDVVCGEAVFVFPVGLPVDWFVAEPAGDVVFLCVSPEGFAFGDVFGVVAPYLFGFGWGASGVYHAPPLCGGALGYGSHSVPRTGIARPYRSYLSHGQFIIEASDV